MDSRINIHHSIRNPKSYVYTTTSLRFLNSYRCLISCHFMGSTLHHLISLNLHLIIVSTHDYLISSIHDLHKYFLMAYHYPNESLLSCSFYKCVATLSYSTTIRCLNIHSLQSNMNRIFLTPYYVKHSFQ